MSEHQQPKEYIITMGRIIKARNMLMADGYHNAEVLDRVVNLLRSRPHPAPMANVDGCLCLGCKVEDKGNGEPEYCLPIRNSINAAARKAREDFIDEAITQCEWDGPITQEDVWRKLESLRSTPQQAGDQHE